MNDTEKLENLLHRAEPAGTGIILNNIVLKYYADQEGRIIYLK